MLPLVILWQYYFSYTVYTSCQLIFLYLTRIWPTMTFELEIEINSVTIDFRKLYSTWAYGCFVRCACPINNRTNKRNQPKHHHSGRPRSSQDSSPIYTKIELFKINFIRSITQRFIRQVLLTSQLLKSHLVQTRNLRLRES